MKKIYILATAALALASCSSDDNYPVEESVALQVSATIDQSNMSRAADTEWAKGDRIGISSTVGTDGVGDKEPYINVPYTTDGDGTFTGDPIYFYNNMTLTAYYPFDGEVPGKNGVITATTSADYQTADKQPLIDFLWDSKTGVGKQDFSATNNNVNFTFAHKMSKISFTFLSSEPTIDEETGQPIGGVDVGTMISYSIDGMVLDGTFNTATGECTIEDAEAENLSIKVDKIVSDEKNYERVRTFDPLIVFPQKTPSEGNFSLHITTDELNKESDLQNYKCVLGFRDNEIKSGCHYKFTIKVTKRGLIVGKLTIEPWYNENERYLTATIDGQKQFNE